MVLFFLIFFLVVVISIFIIINSSFKLSISKLIIDTEKKKIDYELKFGLYFMKKIKIIGIKINKKKIAKIKKGIQHIENSKMLKKLTKINMKKLSVNFEEKIKRKIKNNNLELVKIVKAIRNNLKIETLELKMDLKVGVEDVIITSIFIAIISSIISIILGLTAKNLKKKKNNYYYRVMPIYGKENIFKLNLNCIINLKLVHIINIIYMIVKKGRSDKYVRTSNRRSYGYCHE